MCCEKKCTIDKPFEDNFGLKFVTCKNCKTLWCLSSETPICKSCDCKETSCQDDCKNKHTHKTFSCEVCEPLEYLEERVERLEQDNKINKLRVGKLFLDAKYTSSGKETYTVDANLRLRKKESNSSNTTTYDCRPNETPNEEQFEVGERVVALDNETGITKDMTYKIAEMDSGVISIINNTGNFYWYNKSYFRKLRKPKEFEDYWWISDSLDVERGKWEDDEIDKNYFNITNVFETEVQAEHTRDRIKKFI